MPIKRKISRPVTAIYIHIPFCQHICDYCDFPKLQYFRLFAEKYLSSLKNEMESYNIPNTIETIYVGGGTPTALDDDLFLELLNIIKPYSDIVKEYTFEANPESLSLEKLQMMKDFGVNRISLGVQTTNDAILKKINRKHTFQDVKTAIELARKVGFDNLNADLIIGLPGVQKEQFKKDLENVTSLGVDHISCYSLTVHPNTMFFINGIKEPKEELSRELYDYAEEFLKEKGFVHYEISNWAKPGKESRHNLTYWKDEHYYGFGMGAAGYIKDIRYTNTKSISKYNAGQYIEEKEQVLRDDDKLYYLMLNLRTNRGIEFTDYIYRFGINFLEVHKDTISRLVEQGLLVLTKDRVYPTYDGMMVLDQIIMELSE